MPDLLTMIFILTMAANIIALARHWQMMRVLRIVLKGLDATQKEFNELVKKEPNR